jgi:hypothetical protein
MVSRMRFVRAHFPIYLLELIQFLHTEILLGPHEVEVEVLLAMIEHRSGVWEDIRTEQADNRLGLIVWLNIFPLLVIGEIQRI